MRWLAALAVLAFLAGCVGSDLQAPMPRTTSSPVADAPAMRRSAGIPECEPAGPGSPVVGGLPDLTLDCLGGDSTVRLASLRGPMLVNLWATWCAPCRSEGPMLARFAAAASERVSVVGVNTADPDPRAAAEFAKEIGWRHRQLQDPDHLLPDALGLKGLPITLFVDAEGRIVYRQVGAFGSEQQLRDLVAAHLQVSV